MKLSELEMYFLEDCANDDMGLWVVPWKISESQTTQDSNEEVREKSINVIRKMMQNGLMEIGTIVIKNDKAFFEPFSMTTDQAVAFIKSEWEKLGRFPSLSEICWFRATPAGEKLAKELDLLD